jgi:hypothetical protein
MSTTANAARAPTIGVENEGALHRALKAHLCEPDDRFEHPVDGYVVDLVRHDGTLIEIQTGGCTPLKRKLADLVTRHDVVLVAPVAVSRTIVKVDDDGVELSRRRSPRAGRLCEIAERLVSLTGVLGHPRFRLDVLLTRELERRTFAAGRARCRKGWVIVGRDLDAVVERRSFRSRGDLLTLLPPGLPERFSTADVAAAARIPRHLAQQLLYVLREIGATTTAGKRQNAWLYERGQP